MATKDVVVTDSTGSVFLPKFVQVDEAGNPVYGTTGANASFAATTTSRIVSAAASTNATSAKASAGVLYHVIGYNAAASLRYVKFYNKASAPTVGTDTPILTLPIPATTAFAIDFPSGLRFPTGIAYALTTGAADNDTGALTAADILGLNVVYS